MIFLNKRFDYNNKEVKNIFSLEKKLKGGKRDTEREEKEENKNEENTFIILNTIVEHFINHSKFINDPLLQLTIETDGAVKIFL